MAKKRWGGEKQLARKGWGWQKRGEKKVVAVANQTRNDTTTVFSPPLFCHPHPFFATPALLPPPFVCQLFLCKPHPILQVVSCNPFTKSRKPNNLNASFLAIVAVHTAENESQQVTSFSLKIWKKHDRFYHLRRHERARPDCAGLCGVGAD